MTKIKPGKIPPTMRVETISYCNESCSFCPYPNLKREKGRISFDLFEKIVEEHSQISGAKLLMPANVGEPLLDPRIFDFLKLATKRYQTVSMFTNSTLLNEDRARRLIDSGLSEIMFTLHGLTEEYFRNITGHQDYQAVRENIARFVELNQQSGSPIRVYFNIYSPHKREDVLSDDLVAQCQDTGVALSIHSLEDIHNWGGLLPSERKEREVGCPRIYDQFGVLHDGRVVPCCVDSEARYILGDVNCQSLQEIFSAEKYATLVEKEIAGALRDIPLCRYCDM